MTGSGLEAGADGSSHSAIDILSMVFNRGISCQLMFRSADQEIGAPSSRLRQGTLDLRLATILEPL